MTTRASQFWADERAPARLRRDPSHAPTFVTADVSFIGLEKALRRHSRCAAPGWRALVLVKPQFEGQAEAHPKGGVVRDPRGEGADRGQSCRAGTRVGRARARCLGLRATGTEGNREVFLHVVADPLGLWMRRGAVTRAAVVINHQFDVEGAIGVLDRSAADAGVELVEPDANADLVLALGGDGTMLGALRARLGTETPVFGFNFGRMGFLHGARGLELRP